MKPMANEEQVSRGTTTETAGDIVSDILNMLRQGSDGVGGDWECSEAAQAVSKLAAARTPDGIGIIAAERRRHFQVEGWTPEHDDDHVHGEMAIAAACYAVLHTDASVKYPDDNPEGSGWPWGAEWFKPKDEIHNLARAGALISAEIDRLRRAAPATTTEGEPQNDMALPLGKTCADCVFFRWCVGLFQCPASNTTCDFNPSRFRESI